MAKRPMKSAAKRPARRTAKSAAKRPARPTPRTTTAPAWPALAPVPRSAKAPAPLWAPASAPQVQRRRRSAHAALSKGTTLFQTDHGPRAAWPASTAKRKKR